MSTLLCETQQCLAVKWLVFFFNWHKSINRLNVFALLIWPSWFYSLESVWQEWTKKQNEDNLWRTGNRGTGGNYTLMLTHGCRSSFLAPEVSYQRLHLQWLYLVEEQKKTNILIGLFKSPICPNQIFQEVSVKAVKIPWKWLSDTVPAWCWRKQMSVSPEGEDGWYGTG